MFAVQDAASNRPYSQLHLYCYPTRKPVCMSIGSYLSEFYLSSARVVATISKAPELFKVDLAPMLIINHNYETHLHGTYTYIQYTINSVSLSLSMGVKDMICSVSDQDNPHGSSD